MPVLIPLVRPMGDIDEPKAVDALKALDFHYLIAYILPGFVLTRVAAYYFPDLATAFTKAFAGGDGALVPLILLLLSALTCGIGLSVLRQQFFDPFLGWCRALGSAGARRSGWRPNYAGLLASKDKIEAYDKAVQHVYRYYQFVCNIAFAVGLLAIARWERVGTSNPLELGITRGLGVLAAVLLTAAVSQFNGWCRVHNQICPSPSRSELKAARAAAALAETTGAPATAAGATAAPSPATAAPRADPESAPREV